MFLVVCRRLQGDFTRDIRLEVIVEEALTLRRQNMSTLVTVHKYKYTMELIRSSRFFKPGLKYSAFVKVAHHDGTPVQDDVNPVSFRYGYTWDTDKYLSFDKPLPRNGIVRVDFYPPADAVNEDVEVEVNSTAPLSHLSYQVLGRGDIVVAHSMLLAGQSATRFRFLATHPMAPHARVLVSTVLEGGEVLADVLDVELDGLLQNFVDVALTPSTTEPGRDVELRLQTRPNSYIGILAVDQSVLQLRAGNDITEDDVREELLGYGHNPALSAEQQAVGIDLPLDRAPRTPRSAPRWRPGAATTQEVFDNAGAVILTNGFVMENVRVEYFSRGLAGPSATREHDVNPRADDPATPRTRRDFRETWLWEHVLDSGADGRASIRRAVPDSITSWVVTAFAVDPLYGLGLTPQPSKLTVFRPFFVTVDLPYSVVRGEVVSLPIVVFNYMDRDVTAEVTLEHAGELEFADVSNENKAILVDLRSSNSFKTNVTLHIPKYIVPGSERIEVSAVGDILGPTIPNLDSLIRMPHGCGEQNMITFVPNVVILDYLKNSGMLSQAVESRARGYMEQGYQQQLTYRHKDGSFSAFGESDPSGSTWLTAFVARAFRQGQAYIPLEERVVDEALQWLAEHQAANGSFPELGTVVHASMQGGAARGLALTSYVLTTFLYN
ncbi:Thioester-containing protein, partial [Frankliniella occidentalis]